MQVKLQLVMRHEPDVVVGSLCLRGGEIEALFEDPEIQTSVQQLVGKYMPSFPKDSRASQKVQHAARVLGFFRVLDLLKVVGLGVKAESPDWLCRKTRKAKTPGNLFDNMMMNERFKESLQPAFSGQVTFSEAINQYMKEDASSEIRRLYERASVHLGII